MKPTKDIYIGARMDQSQVTRVKHYVKAIKGMTRGELIRRATDEYMENHPVKQNAQEGDHLPSSVKKLSGKE